MNEDDNFTSSKVLELTEIESKSTDNSESKNNDNRSKMFTEIDFLDENNEIDEEEIQNCLDYCIYLVNLYSLKIKYLNKIFTVIFGNAATVLIISLFSDLKPSIIPFEIVPIQWSQPSKFTQQLSIFFTFVSFITKNMLFMRVVLVLSFGIGIISMFLSEGPTNLSMITWYFIILLINSKHTSIICYDKRHINFDEDRELI